MVSKNLILAMKLLELKEVEIITEMTPPTSSCFSFCSSYYCNNDLPFTSLRVTLATASKNLILTMKLQELEEMEIIIESDTSHLLLLHILHLLPCYANCPNTNLGVTLTMMGIGKPD